MPPSVRAPNARWVALLPYVLWRVKAESELTFSLFDPIWDHGVCCQTEFFDQMVSAMEQHPAYVRNPAHAQILFLRLDTLRQCEWPDFEAAKWVSPEGKITDETTPGCVPGSGNHPYPENVSEDVYSCDWCCRSGADQFVEAVRWASVRYGVDKQFVFFKNAQDNFHECSEFLYAKVATATLPATVRFVGFQLQISQLTLPENELDRNEYPIVGINLLTPLHPQQSSVVESDESRASCNLAERDVRACFSGNIDPDGFRQKLFDLDGKPGTETIHIYKTTCFGCTDPMGYAETLKRSVFAYVPKGDEHYSFRLTEVIAAGAVPVIVDDDWVAPYGSRDASDWVIRIPENAIESSIDLINSISDEQICDMRRNASVIWSASKDMNGLVNAMVKSLGTTAPKAHGKKDKRGEDKKTPTKQTEERPSNTPEQDRKVRKKKDSYSEEEEEPPAKPAKKPAAGDADKKEKKDKTYKK